MTLDEYQKAALRTAKDGDTDYDLLHAALGIATEGGEFTSEVKRVIVYKKELDGEVYAHIVEELGDLMWYLAVAARGLGVSLTTIAEYNISKLQARYPEKYTDEHAEARLDKCGLDHRNS